MLTRTPGPALPKPVWTRRRVMLSMVAGWREGKRPAYLGKHRSTAASVIDWASMYLPEAHPMAGRARTYLLAQVWAAAEGESFRAVCEGRPTWKRSSVIRWGNWALDHIVESLNADDARARERIEAPGSLPAETGNG